MIYVTGGGAWTGVEVNGGATLFTGGTGTFTTASTQSGYVSGRRLRVDDCAELVAAR